LRYKIEVTYIAAVTAKKVRFQYNRYRNDEGYVDMRFTYVLAEIETKKWPWSKPVTDCEVFVHNSHWKAWRYAGTLDRVRKSVARALTDCLRGYMAGYGDGKDANKTHP
jgi:hypothetical protein